MSEARGSNYDAIVIGGGPSGSSYAITLGRRGHSVLVLEREKFPLDAATQTPGVTVEQRARVTRLLFSGVRISGVRYTVDGEEHTASGRFVIDASGRAGVIARGLNLRKTDNDLKMAAVFKHFGGVDEANNPATEGDIQLGLHEDGWLMSRKAGN